MKFWQKKFIEILLEDIERRTGRKWTQQELADFIGVSDVAVNYWLQGKREMGGKTLLTAARNLAPILGKTGVLKIGLKALEFESKEKEMRGKKKPPRARKNC